MARGIALENAPVSMRAFTGNLKLIGTEKSEVRGLEERTLLKKEEGLRVEGEIGWVLCGLPSFLSS